MRAEIVPHALDRVPLSLIIDDSTVLINLNYFFNRDYNIAFQGDRRWEDMPVVHPESFTREWAQWCAEQGVKGKFSIVPCPAGIGRIDQDLPLFSRAQQESWLQMCRQIIMPHFDITPEMLTHTFVLDLETMQPLPNRIWEQYHWNNLPTDQEELVTDYIALSCRILHNVGLTPTGVTSPGGFGDPLDFYTRCVGNALRRVTGSPTPFLFKRIELDGPIETPVWHASRSRGTAVGEIIAATVDRTGSWTGYDQADADYYIGEDLQSGRLPAVIDAGDPTVLCSHWQGMYGMHDGDRRGFKVLKTVVERLRQRDPRGERTRWRKASEITNYACARSMAHITAEGPTVHLELPVLAPELTLRIQERAVRGVMIDGKPLQRVERRVDFRSNTFLPGEAETLIAFDPTRRNMTVDVT